MSLMLLHSETCKMRLKWPVVLALRQNPLILPLDLKLSDALMTSNGNGWIHPHCSSRQNRMKRGFNLSNSSSGSFSPVPLWTQPGWSGTQCVDRFRILPAVNSMWSVSEDEWMRNTFSSSSDRCYADRNAARTDLRSRLTQKVFCKSNTYVLLFDDV